VVLSTNISHADDVLRCAGSWAEDKMDGQGTYHYSSGDIYTGGFRQGKKHGSGMYNFKAHACQFLGIWSDGEFVEGKWVSWVQSHTQRSKALFGSQHASECRLVLTVLPVHQWCGMCSCCETEQLLSRACSGAQCYI
jgi:hypothetical protein